MADPMRRRQRLAEELEESGLRPGDAGRLRDLVVEEIDLALHPKLHERRAPSGGTIVEPTNEPAQWTSVTRLAVTRTRLGDEALTPARLFTDGLSSWLLRRVDGDNEWILFDRPAGSERDLVVLVAGFGGTIVQRHPTGAVRVVGPFGVLRWNGYTWHLEPPIDRWVDTITASGARGDPAVLAALVEFAVHDLGAMGIGALLVYRPEESVAPPVEERLPIPPSLDICEPAHLAPLRHALTHVDGAAVFDAAGVLRHLGVRLVPSATAEETVDPLGGMRHTAARRYSHDEPLATVIAVSEDGPVSVLRNGAVLGMSPADED